MHLNMTSFFTCIFVISASGVAAKNEGTLPADAVPLTSKEVVAIFSGKTIDWKIASAFWAPDGRMVGYYPKAGEEGFAEGKWSVKGNEMCYTADWYGNDKAEKPYRESNCQAFYRSGKETWIENTKDQEKYQGDIWTGIEKKLKSGDKVSKKAAKLKAKYGY